MSKKPAFASIYNHKYFKFDIVSSIVVFLVAIPLCLGIALASHVPLFAGLLSGIIGGIIVGLLSPSQVSVSGPAAGMAAVIVAAMSQLGDFQTFLLALTLAGVLQIIMGICRAGFMADYIPSNLIQGLLCAIGILLIIKQLPLAFTLSSSFDELKAHLLETTEEFTVQPLFYLSYHINTGAMFITLISLAILYYFDKTKVAFLKNIPAPILVVITGVIINEYYMYTDSPFAQAQQYLVNIPKAEGWGGFVKQFTFPDWSAWSNIQVYMSAVTIAVVASLETLLNIKAAEKIDVRRRIGSKDQELLAQGIGNTMAGLLGGIPITSVIVRTSVNIQAGAHSKMSAVFHGMWIMIAVMLIPHWLNKIPLSSLAAVLLFTGYKLTKPKIYKTIYAQGMDRFIPFIVTVVSVVAFNLLEGILIGLAVSLFYILKTNSQARLDIVKEMYPQGAANRLILPQQISFLNKASLVAELNTIPKDSQLIIDARYSHYIDKEIIEFIQEFQKEQAPMRNIALNLIGFKEHYDIHNYIDFINVTTYDVQSVLMPREVLEILREGNARFLSDTKLHRSSKIDIEHTAVMQHPIGVVLGCIDSRVPVETVFDMGFGDLFCVRVAGNVVNDDILASIEYACHVVGAKLIVVLGHTRCGAIQSACDGVEKGHITQLLAKIKPAIQAEKSIDCERDGQNSQYVRQVTEFNIANTLSRLYQESDILRTMITENEISLVGANYDVNTGRVTFSDYTDKMLALNPEVPPALIENMRRVLEV